MNKVGTFFKSILKWIVANKTKSIVIGSVAAVAIIGTSVGIALATRHDHEPLSAVIENEVSATCTSAGSYDEVVYCGGCDEELERKKITVDALGHTEVTDEAVAPTCTATGLTEGKHCSVCDGVLVAQNVVDALGHTEVIDEAVAPTCTATGLTEGKHCSVCDEVLVAQNVVDALGHTEVIDEAVAPTCTATGLTEGKHCSVCDEVLVAQNVVDALGHTEVIDEAVAPTCTATGLTEGKHCSVCDEVLVAQNVVDALGHIEVIDEAVAPTCTATGLTEGKHCSACGEVLLAQQEIAKTPHSYDDEYDESCNNCGFIRDALCGHFTATVIPAVAPTCTDTGLTEGKICAECEEVLVPQTVVDALGHTEATDRAVAPTCTKTGLTAGKHCSVCGEVLVAQNVVDALGHTEVTDREVAPTCIETGLTAGKHCSVCNKVLVAQNVVDALGHDRIEHESKAHTYDEIGWDSYVTCSRCDYSTYVEWPAGPHDVQDGYCTICRLPESTPGLKYVLNPDGKSYTVTGLGTCTATDIVIGIYNNLDVTSIGEDAFRNCYSITSVTIPESVTSIGDDAFYYCESLYVLYNYSDINFEIGSTDYGYIAENAKVLVNNGVTSYPNDGYEYILTDDDFLFRRKNEKYELIAYCGGKDTVTLPTDINAKSYSILEMRGVVNVIIPDGITSIADFAFNNCNSLISVTIPNSVTSISKRAFSYCPRLISIAVDENNQYYKSIDGNLYTKDGKEIIRYAMGKHDTAFTIPNTVTNIRDYSFEWCSSLRSVSIPDSVISIGDDAFECCSSLTSVKIPDSVIYIGKYAFYACEELTIYCEAEAMPETWNPNWNSDNLPVVWGYHLSPSDVSLFDWRVDGESVTITGYHGNLAEVVIPSYIDGLPVTAIDAWALGKSGFEKLYIPEGVTSIGESAIRECKNLLSVSLPSTLKTLGTSAFAYCENLTAVEIPDGIEKIDGWSFMCCTNLKVFVLPENIPYIGSYAFYYCNDITLFCKAESGSIPTYSGSIVWGYDPTNADDFVWDIYSDYATLRGYTGSDEDIVIPVMVNGVYVKVINDFYHDNPLHSLTILDGSVEEIWNSGFRNCQIEHIVIGDSVDYDLEGKFAYCEGLKYIEVSENNPSYKSVDGNLYTKDGKTLIQYAIGKEDESFTIPSGVISIGDYAFAGCQSIYNVDIPNSVIDIGAYAFESSGVTFREYGNVYYLGTAENPYKILWRAKSTLITACTIHEDTQFIAGEAFSGCSYLTEVELPDSLVTIGYRAFADCGLLESVILPDSLMHVGGYAFGGCTNLKFNRYDNAYYLGNSNNPYLALINQTDQNIESCIIHYQTKVIATGAFGSNFALTEIVIPDFVVSIGSDAFSHGYCLTIYCEVMSQPETWDSRWNSADSAVVWNCNVNDVAEDGYIYTVIDGVRYAIRDNQAKVVRNGDQIVTAVIRSEISYKGRSYPVTAIDDGGFIGCRELVSVTIPEGIITIGDYAFYSCEKLTSIEIPDSVTSIGAQAFCDYAYGGSLVTIVIGSGLSSIGDAAFYAATDSLLSFTVSEDNMTYKSIDGNLYSKDGKTLICYAGGKTDSEFVIPDTVTAIGDYAFCGNDYLRRVFVPDSVTSVGRWAFPYGDTVVYCEAKEQPAGWHHKWENGVKQVKWGSAGIDTDASYEDKTYVFVDGVRYEIRDGEAVVVRQSDTLKEANIVSSVTYNGVSYPVTSIDEYAFSSCKMLKSVSIPDSVISIGKSAFYYCTSLTNINIPEGVTNIENNTFYCCRSLTSIKLPSSLESIGRYALGYCSALSEITIPGGVTFTDDVYSSLDGCTGLKKITISGNSNAYKSIDGNLYTKDGKTLLLYAMGKTDSEFIIPDGVERIEESAFRNNAYLTSIVIPDSVTYIGGYAFYECSSLAKIIIPESVTEIGYEAFSFCYALTVYCEREYPSTSHGLSGGWSQLYHSESRSVIWGYKGDTYTYCFDTDGKCEIPSITSDEAIVLPFMQIDGYFIAGWYDTPEFNGREYIVGTRYYSSENQTLYAKWMPVEEGIQNSGGSVETGGNITKGRYFVTVDEPGETLYFTYIPEESGYVNIYSELDDTWCDPYCYFYDEYWSQLGNNDDYNDNQFFVSYYVNAGQIYYIAIALCNIDMSATFVVVIE